MSEAMILIIFGGIFALTGVIVFGQTMIERKKCSKVTTGIVKEITTDENTEQNQKKKKVSYTTIEYTVGEETYIQKSETGSTMNAHYIGEKIEIHYDPQNPKKAYWGTNEFLSLVAGIVFTSVGVRIIYS
ncbi:MAG: DUF3592 domain-containing protein [Clostridia bacterium]|jgi:hypothetical protein|nr:DUF3592 domain-containing protein [Clostridia bacterium]